VRKIILSLLFISIAYGSKAGDGRSALSATEMVWFGLDFTKAAFTGGFDQTGGAGIITGNDLKNKWIPGWNAMIMNQPESFDMKKSFRKDNVFFDLKSVNELNNKIYADECIQQTKAPLKRTEIDEMVKQYHSGTKKEGIGLSFIVESFNKETQMAVMYVTFFDIAEKKVLISEKISAKAMGIGMLNSWSGAIKTVLKQIDATEYQNWKNKY
jgi:hypothetical protein